MLVRVAVVPHPPLLVPELVGGADQDANEVRQACLAVARRLGTAARRWVAVGAEPSGVDEPRRYGPDAVGTFRGYGVDVVVRLESDRSAGTARHAEADAGMPLPALVTGWLRGQVGADQATAWVVPADLSTEGCRLLGRRLAAELAGPEPVGLLVTGDGSHRHGERSVGRPDPRAATFDEAVSGALAAADPAGLLRLDSELAAALGAVGRAPWQVLAGLAESVGPAGGNGAPGWRCVDSRLLIPFGVAYHLAVWDPVR